MLVVCEPDCRGFVHAEVNAGLIAVLRAAFPGEPLAFFAEREHLRQAAEVLEEQGVPAVELRPLRRLPFTDPLLRWPGDRWLARRILGFAARRAARAVVFCSVTGPGLLALQAALRRRPEVACLAALHGILAGILEPPRRLKKRLFWLRRALERGGNPGLRYLVFGAPIQRELARELPALAGRLVCMDLPHFACPLPETGGPPGDPVRFGSLGVAHRDKGSELFFRLAREVTAAATARRAEFVLVGHLVDRPLRGLAPGPVRISSPHAPLSRAEFAAQAQALDYCLFLYPPEAYRLRASAALLDAFALAKPVIALRTPLTEHYFARLGDIGFLCEDYEGMRRAVLAILDGGCGERYLRQRETLREARGCFTPASLAPRLREALA